MAILTLMFSCASRVSFEGISVCSEIQKNAMICIVIRIKSARPRCSLMYDPYHTAHSGDSGSVAQMKPAEAVFPRTIFSITSGGGYIVQGGP